MLNCRIATTLISLMVMIPRPALSGPNPVLVSKLTAKSVPDLVDELDADDTRDCLSLGELDIVFRTDNDGPPDVGIILTDPRGRRIGFDPLSKHGWQQLPVAQGDIDCDVLEGHNTCRGLVQVCGPLSGTYKLELVAEKTTDYTVSISARSRGVIDGNSRQSSLSQAELRHLPIRARSRHVVLVNYSRDPQEMVTAQLQEALHAQRTDMHFRRHPHLEASKKQAKAFDRALSMQ